MKTEYVLSGVTLIIGAFVAFVGYQQYLVSRERFKLDLFEKRFAVYKGVQVFLSYILRGAKVELEELFKFRADTQDAVFLFGDDIPDYIGQIDKAALELMATAEELKDLPVGEERSRMAQKKTEQIKWLIDQLPKLRRVFGPYLKFKSWKCEPLPVVYTKIRDFLGGSIARVWGKSG
jgi:hypothetical protein